MQRLLALLVLLAALAGAAWWWLIENRDTPPAWLKGTAVDPGPGSTILYRWKDGQGRTVVGDKPPPEGTPYESRTYRHDTNILPIPPELQEQ